MPLLKRRSGVELVMVIVLISLLSAVGLAALTIVNTEAAQSRRLTQIQQSFNIAEAGVSYYRWHLAHYPNDYQDGTSGSGPYIHNFSDATGQVIGKYELLITPPVTGSTITTVQSTGYLLTAPSTKKVLTVRLGIPSLTQYSVLSNSDIRFGTGTTTYGPIHSNGGIRFDGLAYGLVTSADSTYVDPDDSGTCTSNRCVGGPYAGHACSVSDDCGIPVFGVHTEVTPVDPYPPLSVPSRSDVFAGGRQFPVAPIDFAGITADLSGMKNQALSNGLYLGASNAQGYHVKLFNNGKMTITIVNSQLSCQFRSGTGSCSQGICAAKSCSNNVTRSCNNNNGCVSPGTCKINTCASSAGCPSGVSCNIISSCSTDSDCTNGGTCLNWKTYGFCAADYNHSCTGDTGCQTCTGHPNGAVIYCTTSATCSTAGAGTCASVTAGSCEQASFSIGTASGSETPAIVNGTAATNIPYPANGIIFLGDNVWVDGTINHARLTIVAAEDDLSTGNSDIYINNNLKYTNYDGTDTLGLIAQNNILVGYFSQNNIEIDGALIAQKGRVGRAYYGSTAPFTSSSTASNFQLSPAGSTLPNGGASETSCSQFRNRASLTAKGALATNQRYGFAWLGNNIFSCASGIDNDSGYCNRNLTFDSYLTYGPPPSFPTTGEYQIISFDEK